jgi:mannose-1-phosphate guanylyltransferase
MERADRVLVVEMGCHWVDVGSWPAIESVVHADQDGNVSACPRVLHLGSRGNIVVSEDKHLIATIGVDDLVIVHSPDATLICTRRDTQGIKELADMIRQQFGEEYA